MSSPTAPAPEQQTKLNVPYPPDFVFKYRKNRQTPSSEVLLHQQTMFVFQWMKYPPLLGKSDEWFGQHGLVKRGSDLMLANGVVLPNALDISRADYYGDGQLAEFEGVPHPSKGHPVPEAVYAANIAKRFTVLFLKALANPDIRPKKLLNRLLKAYAGTCDIPLSPYVLEEDFYSRCPREIYEFVGVFLEGIGIEPDTARKVAEVAAMMLEYDNAYRLRFEDAMSTITKDELLKSPAKALRKALQAIRDRDPNPENPDKFDKVLKLLRVLFWLPSVRKAFKRAVTQARFENFQLDTADRYHVLLWGDYNFLGKSLDERIEMYKEIHKDGLPRRIIIRPTPQ